jgi:hypothetical protein
MRRALEWGFSVAIVVLSLTQAYQIGSIRTAGRYSELIDQYVATTDHMATALYEARDSLYQHQIRDLLIGCTITIPNPIPAP